MARERIFPEDVVRNGVIIRKTYIADESTDPDVKHKCPTRGCGKESIYSRSQDRYFHIDGTENQSCWRMFGRQEAG